MCFEPGSKTLRHRVIVDRIGECAVAPAVAITAATLMVALRGRGRRASYVSNTRPQTTADAWWMARPVSVKRRLGAVSPKARRGHKQCVFALIGSHRLPPSIVARAPATMAAAPPA